MHLSRRDVLGRFAALAALPLLSACQTQLPAPTAAPPTLPPATPTPLPVPVGETRVVPATPTPEPSPTAEPRAAVGRPMYQMDPQHTGRSPNRGPRDARVLMSFDTSNFQVRDGAVTQAAGTADIQSSAAVGPDGNVYLANHQGVLFALRDPRRTTPATRERQTLDLAWRCHPPEASSWHATPAIGADGTVYLGFSRPGSRSPIEATLYALRAPAPGALEADVAWAFNLGPGRQTSSPTLGPDGTVYVVSGSGWLFAIRPDGQVAWTAETGPALKAAPALSPDGKTAYVASMNGTLYAVNTPDPEHVNASVRWTFKFADYPGRRPPVTASSGPAGADGIGSGASPTIASDGTIYIGANNSNLYALTPNGKLLWLYEAEREIAGIWSTAALSADESLLYFGANKGGIYALNRADGSLAWQFNVVGSIYSSPSLDTDNVLYTSSTVGHIFALDGQTGHVIFDFDVGQPVWTAPAIRPDGSLLVADRQGRVLVLG